MNGSRYQFICYPTRPGINSNRRDRNSGDYMPYSFQSCSNTLFFWKGRTGEEVLDKVLYPLGFSYFVWTSGDNLVLLFLVFHLLYLFVCLSRLCLTVLCCDSDINECSAVQRVCSHFCENLLGSFLCSCPVGHALSSDNRTCEGEALSSVLWYFCMIVFGSLLSNFR